MPRQINPITFPKHIFAEVKQCSFIQVYTRHSISGWPQLIFKFSRMMVFSRWASTIPSAFTLHAWANYCLHWTKALIWKDLGNCSLKTAIKSGPTFSHTQTSTYKWTGPSPKLWRTLSFHKHPFSSDSCCLSAAILQLLLAVTPALSAFVTTIQTRKAREGLQDKVQGS